MYNIEQKAKEAKEWVAENGLSVFGFGDSVKALCDHLGVDAQTYYNWMKEDNSIFSKALHEGYDIFKQEVFKDCATGLRTLVRGYNQKKVVESYMNISGTKTPITSTETKTIAPDLEAIKWVQSNMDSEHWSNKQKVDTTIKGEGFKVEVHSEEIEKALDKMLDETDKDIR